MLALSIRYWRTNLRELSARLNDTATGGQMRALPDEESWDVEG